MKQAEMVKKFLELHTKRPLILPNAWDAGSARVIEAAGAPAIATTSAGVSWSLGRPDGQNLGREEMLQAIRQIVATVSVPVNADIEGGYGTDSLKDVAETVKELIASGVAGINLEDTPGHDGEVLLAAEEHAERIAIARKTAKAMGGDLVINARIDVYLFQVGAPESRFQASVQRAKTYLQAGADCVFVPGVVDAETIGRLVKAIDGPLNIMAMPGAPSAPQLGRMGVARVSVGPGVTQVALAAAQRAAKELLEEGTYTALEAGLPFAELNAMFARRSAAMVEQ
jgi:2-methylisocitrate lyase-like PEP mutase family enzyme